MDYIFEFEIEFVANTNQDVVYSSHTHINTSHEKVSLKIIQVIKNCWWMSNEVKGILSILEKPSNKSNYAFIGHVIVNEHASFWKRYIHNIFYKRNNTKDVIW